MNQRTWRTALAAGILVVGSGWWAAGRLAAMERAEAVAAASQAAAAELQLHAEDIAFYEARAARDPESAGDRTQLAALYLQRARETSDFEDYVRAEATARASLALRTQRNAGAYALLTTSLLAQHRFVEARDAARQLVAAEPGVDAYRALLGETCVELGDYAGARAAFDSITPRAFLTPAVAPRLARWAEIRGDTARARYLMRRSLALVRSLGDPPREQVAWFHLRAGDLELRQGNAARAEEEFRRGLATLPGDHRLLAAMARLAAGRGAWTDAIRYGDSAIAVVLDPATLGVVSDAYAALADTARAGEYFRTMEVAVGQQPGAYHRAWSLFLLDHGRQISEVLTAAEAELVERRDVHGYDLLAWALYKQGRLPDARRAMASALAQGTQDAVLFYHAGMIERAAGDAAAAGDHLRRALALAPALDARAAATVRAVLDSLPRAAVAIR